MAVTPAVSVVPAVNPVASGAFLVDSAAFAVASAVIDIDPAATAVVQAALALSWISWIKLLLHCIQARKQIE